MSLLERVSARLVAGNLAPVGLACLPCALFLALKVILFICRNIQTCPPPWPFFLNGREFFTSPCSRCTWEFVPGREKKAMRMCVAQATF